MSTVAGQQSHATESPNDNLTMGEEKLSISKEVFDIILEDR